MARSRVAVLGAAAALMFLLVAGSAQAATPSPFFNGFETDTSGWFDDSGTIAQQPSGYSNSGGYADGITSASGSYHARLTVASGSPCTEPYGSATNCPGPFTRWGGYTDTFPTGGYTTKLDIYLDTSWAATHPDVRFDWDVSSSNNTGGFLRDFVFNAGTTPSGYSGTPGFVIGASTNADRNSTYPSNPCPSPSATPNSCRAPVYITTSGWYTFEHRFFDGGTNGLGVEMKILDSSGGTVADWTIYGGDPMSTVGGNRYGWFPNQEIPDLPIDNSQLLLPDTQGPITSSVMADPNPVATNGSTKLTATVDDTNTGGSNIQSASYCISGDQNPCTPSTPMSATDTSFDQVSEAVQATFAAPSAAGLYDVCVNGTDSAGNTGDASCTTLVVYDPSGGFVTGGGWIDSPAGAVRPNGSVVVSPANMQGWGFFDDNGNGGTGQMVSGPATPPLGTGSAELAVTNGTNPPTTSQGYALGTAAYAGTPLADITNLSYWSYQPGPTLAIALQFDVKYQTSDTAYDGRLVYEPYQNGAVSVGSGWQQWSPLDGIWWASHSNKPLGDGGTGGLCPQSAPCPWSTILADFPDATISGGTIFKAGSGWSNFDGNVDAFTIGVNGSNTTYDFEPNAPTGKATFGFVSKYQNGASQPTGTTEFVFKNGNLTLHSTDYQWLVVTGSNYAMFKGTADVNGVGGYGFMVWAGDGTGTNGSDTFRIKITDPSGNVIYDNGMDQPIAGGSIIVHK